MRGHGRIPRGRSLARPAPVLLRGDGSAARDRRVLVVSAAPGAVGRYSARVSHYDYPDDEFDDGRGDGPAPIGVHRAEPSAWRSWVSLLAVLILVPILAWGAVKLLGHTTNSSNSTAGTSTATPAGTGAPASQGATDGATPSDGAPGASATPTGEPDMSTGITLYNGTSTQGLAGRTGEKLTAAGYTQITIPQGTYSETSPEKTTVYYKSAEHAATAQAVVAALGGGEAVEDAGQAQTNPIVIVLREDYQETGGDGAAATSADGAGGKATAETGNGGTGNDRVGNGEANNRR